MEENAIKFAKFFLSILPAGMHQSNIAVLVSVSPWNKVLLNAVIVHIMLPDVREYYKLEKIWERPEAVEKVAAAREED